MRVLGVDPGSRVTGSGVIEEDRSGLRRLASLAATPRGTRAERLGQIATQLQELVQQWRPDAVAIERAFVGRNVDSALRLGEVRGALLAACGLLGVSPVDYPPATVKVAVTGSGGADKEMVARGLARLLDEACDAGDAADALAVAVCHLRHMRFAGALRASAQPARPGLPSRVRLGSAAVLARAPRGASSV
jgi:crossover junction endodeoxyribonuclease RuvC